MHVRDVIRDGHEQAWPVWRNWVPKLQDITAQDLQQLCTMDAPFIVFDEKGLARARHIWLPGKITIKEDDWSLEPGGKAPEKGRRRW